MGLEQVQQLGKAAGREAVAAADARAFLEMDGLGEPVLGEQLVPTRSDFSRLTGPPRRCPPTSRKTWLAM
jgi:hypothetical protein